ncbi:MAG: carboxypeptidase-like regulatory domain-containing protein [Bacteroidales bacterium]|nr:carboxypeptidase-like regulatory domain-containing protein [Bacteroidales bacterium]
MQKYILFIIWLSLLMPFLAGAQQDEKHREQYYEGLVQFSGAVVTGDSLRPIPFTHIIDRNTGFGTISDYYGYFSFVARKGDTIDFSSIGFKKAQFIIPDTIRSNRYTMFQVMTADTVYLTETVIYPWPTREQFKEAFLNLNIPDDDLEIARKNLSRHDLYVRAQAMPMDGSMNYRHYIDQQVSKLYYAGQTQPISLLNPFAWAQFFKAWQDGKFKRQDYKP